MSLNERIDARMRFVQVCARALRLRACARAHRLPTSDRTFHTRTPRDTQDGALIAAAISSAVATGVSSAYVVLPADAASVPSRASKAAVGSARGANIAF